MKKKLLVFASTFPRWENDTIPPFVYELSKRLTKDFDVTVLAPSFPGAKKEEVMDGMKVKRFHYGLGKYETLASNEGIMPSLKKSKWNYLKVPFFMAGEFFALRREIKENRPDVIHAHWIISQGFIAMLCKKLYGVEYVVTTHGSDLMTLRAYNWIKKIVLRNARKITVVSNMLKEEALKIDSTLKVDVIPMGIDTKLFNPKKRDNSIKKNYKIKKEFLLFVGRLAPEKGIDVLIEAMPEVIKKFPNAKLLIIGKGTLEDGLKKRVKELKLENNITFVGWIDNKELPRYYATADVFVCPSRREGFGLTFAEAGLCGCWLIGTNTGGITDIISEGKNGFLVKVDDKKDLIQKIVGSLRIKTQSKKLVKLKNNFSWDSVSKRYSEVLR
jgi:glycosyltransferase involved in cell wall biosynthesis